ncbi:MAG TPA: ribosome biogenesis GTPase Der [Saprospiraceae bacterium]|nr:ribosome biogenesis GTPase Der [Saprospiraceae bacterium]
MSSIIAIVGRPNVGKSTLYNRLLGQKDAIIDDFSGVTRDRKYGLSEWNGKQFTVVDTGGFVEGSDDVFEAAIRSQVHIAIEEADIIIFMVDTTTGITDLDDDIAGMLRRVQKPIFLVVNKVENLERMLSANEFWALGFENTFFISSLTGSGTGDLLDAVSELVVEEEPEKVDMPKFAILGRPNAGKSSLVNALLGEERNIVTDVAGTTRDSIHTVYNKFDMKFMLIDTAGIRKKSKVKENLEFYSVMRAIKALEEADVMLLVVDATLGVESQDMNLFGVAQKRNKGIVILINKWDLVEKETNSARDYEAMIKKRIAPFTDVPIIFISALDKTRIHKALQAALRVYENRIRKVTTSKLNEVMLEAIERHPPQPFRGRYPKIKYVTQLPLYYPAFAFFANTPKDIKENYRNYLENQLRANWDFSGVPVSIFIRKK